MEQVGDLLKSIENKLATQTENSSFSFTISWQLIYAHNKNTAYYTQHVLTPIVLNSLNFKVVILLDILFISKYHRRTKQCVCL